MGEYASLYDEQSLADEFYGMDHAEDIFDEWGIPTVNTSNKRNFPVEKNFDYIHLDCSLLKFGDEWLMRKGTEDNCKLNETVYIASVTDKAVLFTFSGEWKNALHWEMQGKQFWLPKSILYKHKKHIKVIYIPRWAKIKIINPE
jgi:hypothetical protein